MVSVSASTFGVWTIAAVLVGLVGAVLISVAVIEWDTYPNSSKWALAIAGGALVALAIGLGMYGVIKSVQ